MLTVQAELIIPITSEYQTIFLLLFELIFFLTRDEMIDFQTIYLQELANIIKFPFQEIPLLQGIFWFGVIWCTY